MVGGKDLARVPPSTSGPKSMTPQADFGYVVPKNVFDPTSDGKTYAIQAMAAWERKPKGFNGPDEKRTGYGGGFQEFDRGAEEERRRRAAEMERQQVAERKATKNKCQFCKRASCIC